MMRAESRPPRHGDGVSLALLLRNREDFTFNPTAWIVTDSGERGTKGLPLHWPIERVPPYVRAMYLQAPDDYIRDPEKFASWMDEIAPGWDGDLYSCDDPG